MSQIANMASHSVDVSLLAGGWVLDAGCRDFSFAVAAAECGCQVIALDPDPEVARGLESIKCDPRVARIQFMGVGLSTRVGTDDLVLMDNVEMRHLARAAGYHQWHDVSRIAVPTTTIEALMATSNISRWDAVKLDIEGAEYEILQHWPGPIAKQISVEFHEHMEPREHIYRDVATYLRSWYDIVVDHAGDTLFVLHKDLL